MDISGMNNEKERKAMRLGSERLPPTFQASYLKSLSYCGITQWRAMAKKQNRDGQRGEYPASEKDPRTDEQREEDKVLARKALVYIRENIKLKKGRSAKEIAKTSGPNISNVRLPDKPTVERCRCGLKPVVPDWSAMGIENPPQVCPGCKDLVERCYCSNMKAV